MNQKREPEMKKRGRKTVCAGAAVLAAGILYLSFLIYLGLEFHVCFVC